MERTKREKALNVIGVLLLFGAALAWGTSFLILKNTITGLPPLYVLGIRFFVSAVILGLVFIKKTVKITRGTFCRGAIIGLVVFLAYLLQTYGLLYTSPGKNAFITSLYCVMTPFFMWFFYKVKPKNYNIIAAVLCVIGIGLVAISGREEHGENELLGNVLTFAAAIFYVFQVIFTDRFSKRSDDPMQLLTVDLFVIGTLFIIGSAAIEIPVYGIESFALNKGQILNIIYLTLVCTLFAQFAQLIGQKLTTASQSAVILSLEGVFGTLFSVIMGAEKLTVTIGAGFAIIFAATLISELKPDFGKLLKRKPALTKNVVIKTVSAGNKNEEGKENMLHVIDNGRIKLTVSAKGAEMTSLVKDGRERLWQNDNGEWDGHAPILFPVCGNCKVIAEGQSLPVYMHGVAQLCDFKVTAQGENFIRLTARETDETKKYYPYDFEFSVTYTLCDDTVKIGYEVKNPADKDMYFACGAHDSFALDDELENYEIVFEKEEKFDSLAHDDFGYLNGKINLLGEGRVIDFGKTPLVNDETFIFKNIGSRKVVLQRKDGKAVAEIGFDGFNNLLFWRPGNGKTVCVEPWLNLPDDAGDETTAFCDKYGVLKLKPHETAEFNREIKYF